MLRRNRKKQEALPEGKRMLMVGERKGHVEMLQSSARGRGHEDLTAEARSLRMQ